MFPLPMNGVPSLCAYFSSTASKLNFRTRSGSLWEFGQINRKLLIVYIIYLRAAPGAGSASPCTTGQ